MKTLYKLLIAAVILTGHLAVQGQSPYTNPSKSLFDDLRKKTKAASSKPPENATESFSSSSSSSASESVRPGVSESEIIEANTTIRVVSGDKVEIVANPVSQTESRVTTLTGNNQPPASPQRQYVPLDGSGLGFFPDSSSGTGTSGSQSISQPAITSSANSNNLETFTSSARPSGTFTIEEDNNAAFGAATLEAIKKVSGGDSQTGNSFIYNETSTLSTERTGELGFTPDSPVSAISGENRSTRVEPATSGVPAGISAGASVGAGSASMNDTGLVGAIPALSDAEIQTLVNDYGKEPEDFASELPPIHSATYEGATTDYKIQPGDIISVEVFQEADLSRELKVASSGEITYPLLSQVKVSGKSAAQAERYLRDLLARDYLVDPHVIITVKEFKVQQVSIQGFVNIPKLITLPPDQPMTIMQALSEAGGIQRIGNSKKIELIRQGEPNRVFKLDQLKKVTDPSGIVYLQPNDIVYVYERGIF